MTDPHPAQLPALGSGAWIWNMQLPPPINGQVRSDSRNWTSAALLTIDRRADDGTDASVAMAAVKAGDTLRLEHYTDPSRWARFDVLAAPIRVVDHFQYPVTYSAGAGTLPNSGTRVLVSLFPSAPSPTGDVVSVSFVQSSPLIWLGRASCKHAQSTTTTYLTSPGNPLDYATMVQASWRQQDLLAGCNCPNETTPENGNVVFDVPLTLQVGQRRIVSQNSATITGPNFLFGPLTCQRSGAYAVHGTLTLNSSIAQGARGQLNIVVGGAVALTVGLIEEAGKATANYAALLNIHRNDSVVFTFDNLSAGAVTIDSMTFNLSPVWTP